MCEQTGTNYSQMEWQRKRGYQPGRKSISLWLGWLGVSELIFNDAQAFSAWIERQTKWTITTSRRQNGLSQCSSDWSNGFAVKSYMKKRT
tara:strand:- start:23 stop:292 length:270 start_codon:yes stop_codon:yes gene_type:complete